MKSALAAAVLLAACGTPRLGPLPESITRADVVAAADEADFRAARARYDAGEFDAAATGFERLFAREPDNVVVGAWAQDAELARLADDADARRAVADRWAIEAERAPTFAACVLAARVADERSGALEWLARAERVDPASPWPAYGRAFVAARASEWADARAYLARALELDPGHPWARWLESWILARDGGVGEAAASLDRWLESAESDPRIDARRVAEAKLDRAILDVLEDEPDRARERLESLRDAPVSAGRAAAAAAAIAQALDEWSEALAHAQRAEHAMPDDVLPLVQQALVFDIGWHDDERAEKAWTRVLAATENHRDLGALFERTRARARIERLRAERHRQDDEP